MRLTALLLLIFFVGCQDYNSNTYDKTRYGKVTLTGSPDFEAAYYIIQQRCTNCHTSTIHNPWASYTNEQDWIDKGYVAKGDPDGSRLIFRIFNYGSTQSDMPRDLGPLPNDEYQQLVDWVTNIP